MTNSKLTLTILLAALIIAGGGYLSRPVVNIGPTLGANPGPDFYNPLVFHNEIKLNNCGTASYTVPALGVADAIGATDESYTTTSVTVTGAALGDIAFVSNNSSTRILSNKGIGVDVEISAANTAVVGFKNWSGVASTTALTTSTIRVCYFNEQ